MFVEESVQGAAVAFAYFAGVRRVGGWLHRLSGSCDQGHGMGDDYCI